MVGKASKKAKEARKRQREKEDEIKKVNQDNTEGFSAEQC